MKQSSQIAVPSPERESKKVLAVLILKLFYPFVFLFRIETKVTNFTILSIKPVLALHIGIHIILHTSLPLNRKDENFLSLLIQAPSPIAFPLPAKNHAFLFLLGRRDSGRKIL